ncbi:hypothetical protein ACKVMT_17550 [Halobacteriales archaeon Cl-PHB]
MTSGPGGLRQWTERFALASAGGLVVSLAVLAATGDRRLAVAVSVFGFLCPMVFGMAYLLLPPYVGRTLVDPGLPGLHFVLALGGAGLLLVGRATGAGAQVWLGAVAWALGVAVFLGALLATVWPVVRADPRRLLTGGDWPLRSTRVATAAIPVALAYLLLGTGRLLASVATRPVPSLVGTTHTYAAGFGALLVFALGARLLIGFYHVDLPRPVLWPVLVAGAVAPALLVPTTWSSLGFRVGAALETAAMVGYLGLVGLVWQRADGRLVGRLGILLGALSGALAVAVAAPLAFDAVVVERATAVHRTAIAWGFFPLTIVGYATLFFPVTEGQFAGATPRFVGATVGLLAVGVAGQVAGLSLGNPTTTLVGVTASLLGAVAYSYLLGRRFLG